MSGGKKSNGNGAEELIWQTLTSQLLPGETLLRNVRFTDAKYGDVEIDFLIVMPDAGVAVVEVKGGAISYEDGQWLTRSRANGNHVRRINPVEQARKAKHAVRRYLDRQPEWHHGLIKSAWFVAMPNTDVNGDMGPEGKREHLIGRKDLAELRERLRNVLLDPLDSDKLPPGDWPDEALSLILRLEHSNGNNQIQTQPSASSQAVRWLTIIATGIVLAIITALFTVRGGWLAAVIVAVVAAGALFVIWRRLTTSQQLKQLRTGLVAASAAGIALGFAGTLALYGEDVTQGDCNPNYLPCIPIAEDLNCSDIKIAVRVVGEDVYRLDRDGNGTGCESYQ